MNLNHHHPIYSKHNLRYQMGKFVGTLGFEPRTPTL